VEAERNIQWAHEYWQALRPWASGVYVNELDAEGSSRVREAYTAETYARLVKVKNRYDPANLFRLNQNIKPTV
jgi:FAD/FMN-containing dehydrogenase